jgi:hypothetical protein
VRVLVLALALALAPPGVDGVHALVAVAVAVAVAADDANVAPAVARRRMASGHSGVPCQDGREADEDAMEVASGTEVGWETFEKERETEAEGKDRC